MADKRSKLKTISKQGGVQSLNRALDLLEAFQKVGPLVGLTNLAEHVGLKKATAYRLLSTLEKRGYVERSHHDSRYRLGVRLFELGAYYQSQIDIRRLALPYMADLVEETHEAAFLCIQEGDEALCVERIEAEHEVRIFALRIGGRLPLHTGAAPRALLSSFCREDLELYASRTGLAAFSKNTISTIDQLFEDVQLTVYQGYTLSLEDVTPGLAAIGAPIRDYSNQIVAAISISGLITRFVEPRTRLLAEAVVRVAQKISKQLGYTQT
jgi:IclR family KDG regulon transcriptional repressor